ncbi:MAG: CHAT domain-containing protein [Anaerolineales bacterium]|nr:CHAT domain-containing protein [Anaerolineales bacterium]
MALTLFLQTENGQITAKVNDVMIGGPTALEELPTLEQLTISPLSLGEKLFVALGGDTLEQLLLADPDRTLLLDIPATDPADDVPWEFATRDRQLLGTRFGLLRLLAKAPPALPTPTNTPLHFTVLAADPLVNDEGQPYNGYRLNLKYELAEIRETLLTSGKAILARRLPPTQDALAIALQQGPAWLHLSCHGTIINSSNGPTAMLLLEDENGAAERFPGRELANLAAPGVLRLVVLSACQTAAGEDQARLAKTLVLDGLPAALGMQGNFADPLSDELAKALYTSLLAGQSLGQAVRQMRFALRRNPQMAGLPVVYIAPGGEQPLALPTGEVRAASLDHSGQVQLVPEVQAPHPLLGREQELYQPARQYKPGKRRIVTVAGTGGMGKTALAAAFARRFAWRWPRGVLALSFASGEPDADQFCADLLRGLGQDPAALPDANRQSAAILEALSQWRGLLLIDNYETILQDVAVDKSEALAIHGLLGQAANGGVDMLLTSREQPAGFRHEVLFPDGGSLSGIAHNPAARLFFEHSTRADEKNKTHHELAQAIAQATEGHPLSITLLAGEFDLSQEIDAKQFLDSWPDELAAARRPGLLPHHVTLAAAFNRSYERLDNEMQQKLRLLSVFTFPFFAEAAAFLWELIDEESKPDSDAARPPLTRLSRGSLLEVAGYFEGGEIPATFRFQPALREELTRRVLPAEKAQQQAAFAAYGAWLAWRGYGEIYSNVALAQLVRASMMALEAATATLDGTDKLWHVRRLAWLKNAYGDTQNAFALLRQALPEGQPPPDPKKDEEAARIDSSLRYELAGLYIIRGDLDTALTLYQESLALKEKIGDIKGKGTTLSMMANLFMARERWEEAENAVNESLVIANRLNYKSDIAFNTVKLGQIYQARNQTNDALANFKKGLALFQQLGAKREIGQVQQIIEALENSVQAQSEPSPLSHWVQEARQAAQAGNFTLAVAAQKQAITLLRQAEPTHENLVTLSVLLFNLSGYLQNSGQFAAAVTALEEVVALDEETNHPDLASDKAALAQARELAANPPANSPLVPSAPPTFADILAMYEAQLLQLPAEQQHQLKAEIARLRQLSPEEQAQYVEAVLAASAQAQLDDHANQARDAAIAARRGDIDPAELAQKLAENAQNMAQGQSEASPLAELAQFLTAAAALLRQEPVPPVPDTYLAHMAAILESGPQTEED